MSASETSKFRHLTAPYCQANGVDIGSGGDPVVPHAIAVDLPSPYTSVGDSPIHYRGDGLNLPFKDGTLGWVYASHLLEDFADWWPALTEWTRVLESGGHLVILIPDRERWSAALARGQPPNLAHKHEGHVGELSTYCEKLGLEPVIDNYAAPDDPNEYTLIFVARKK